MVCKGDANVLILLLSSLLYYSIAHTSRDAPYLLFLNDPTFQPHHSSYICLSYLAPVHPRLF